MINSTCSSLAAGRGSVRGSIAFIGHTQHRQEREGGADFPAAWACWLTVVRSQSRDIG